MMRNSAREIFDSALGGMSDLPDDREEWVPIEAEALKRVYDKLVYECGTDVWFESCPVCVSLNGGLIRSVTVITPAGRVEVSAECFIDCTGNADLCRLSGASVVRPERVQPASLCFYLGGLDIQAFKREPELHSSNPDSPLHKIAADPRYPLITSPHFCIKILYGNVAAINAGYLYGVDISDPGAMFRLMRTGREAAAQYAAALAEYTEAFRNCSLIATAPLLGIRESVRINAVYNLTIDDYVRRARFDDAIARNDYFIDVHSPAVDELVKQHKDLSGECLYYEKGEYYEIPYRSLLSDVDNLLAAGRIIGCDERVQGSVRTMPNALSTGMAAGIAAAVAVRAGKTPARLGELVKEVTDACRL